MYPKDSSSSLSRAFNSWHSPLAMGGEATVEETSVNVGGQSRLLRREYALFTDNADTFKFDESNPLECGHNRAKTQEVINVAGLLYCDECAHRCPRCGHWVVCDEGQEIHNIWYHHDCGRLERLFADIKLLADAQMEIRKVDAAILRNDHAQAQIENIYAGEVSASFLSAFRTSLTCSATTIDGIRPRNPNLKTTNSDASSMNAEPLWKRTNSSSNC